MSGSYPREPLFFFSETIKVGIFDMEAVSKPHTFSENQGRASPEEFHKLNPVTIYIFCIDKQTSIFYCAVI